MKPLNSFTTEPDAAKRKKAYVVKFLQEKGFTLDPDSLDKLIEAAVFNLPEYIGLIETEGKPDTD